MSIRTIEAPGVEIKEIDKSGYSPAMTGTKCYIMGYANKGEPYVPMQFTSKTSWTNYYGEPDNEAERYFYNACMEVINQNGVLYCARIPYDNKALDGMIGYKFNVGSVCKRIPSASEYCDLPNANVSAWIHHDADFECDALKYTFNNKLYREIDGVINDGLEFDDELCVFYNYMIKNYSYKKLLKVSEAGNDWSILSVLNGYYGIIDYVKKYNGKDVYVKTSEYQSTVAKYQDENGIDLIDSITTFEDTIKFYTKDDSGELEEITGSVKYDYDPEYSSQFTEKDNGYRYSAFWYKLDYDTTKELTKVFLTENEASEYIKEFADKNIEGLIKYVPEKYNLSNDWMVIPAKYDYVKISELSNSELNNKEVSSVSMYDETFSSLTGDTTISVLQQDQFGKRVLEKQISSYIVGDSGLSSRFICDGLDCEYLFNTTISDLYGELSGEGTVASSYVSEIYNQMWTGYYGYSLSSIALYNNDKYDVVNSERVDTWKKMIQVYKDSGEITFKKIYTDYGHTQEAVSYLSPYYAIVDGDSSIDNYLRITPSQNPIMIDIDDVQEYVTGENAVPAQTFWVVDKTCATMSKVAEDSRKGDSTQFVGIFPVITTAANALYAQSLIDVPDTQNEVVKYETVKTAVTHKNENDNDAVYSPLSSDLVKQFSNYVKTDDGSVLETVSMDANGYFSAIQMRPDLKGFDTENMKKIGVVVYKAYIDASEGNKVNFTVVESFVGSLDRDAKNPNTGVSTYLPTIINSQSDYIYFFSNCMVSTAQKKQYEKADLFLIESTETNIDETKTGMLGYFDNETEEKISYKSILQGMDNCLEKVNDINERDIDIIPDAGLANIAQYLKSIYGTTAQKYDLDVVDDNGNPLIKNWTCKSPNDVNAWKTVLFKLDNFCKNVRKDCMFIADGPRPLVLAGQKKIVRPSKPTNTIDANILPYVKYATGLNTNYGAGYLDWFKVTDEFSGDEFWCPPSIKAMGVYINTDLNFEYWDAPAGLNRGMVQALDVSFSPNAKQAGSIYTKNWNYSINYPNDGIVLEGQKTFQVKPSSMDRVNVRRLFLRLERQSYKIARYFVYEGSTAYTRQRLVDALTPMFNNAKVGGGIYDYKIICDETNNTADVIDQNELRVKIGIKPVKTAEFILIDFVALSTGGSFSEM